MRQIGYITAILVLLLGGMDKAIAQNKNALTISEDRLILQLDLKSPKKVLDSILDIAGVSKLAAEKILKGDFSPLSNDGWNMSARENNLITFDRPLTDLKDNPQSKPYLITTRIAQINGRPGYPGEVKYGVNKFAKITVYQLSTGLTRFILPDYLQARRVFLSGSFNNWSTLKNPMKKTNGGWMIDLKLDAGAYEYKYIIDGGWRTDPNNLQQVNDGVGNLNSIFYKYNYTFKLNGYASKHRVSVAGSFNKWDANELIMEKKGNTWQRELYLADGRYTYRFVVDGQWTTDPENPVKEKDENGVLNSVLSLGETAIFKLPGYQDAQKVFVAGDFNNWKQDEYALQKKSGLWILPMVLTAGNYNYKFIVDGKWVTDPLNPHRSVEKGQINSFLALKPNYTFRLRGFSDAKTVVLTGTFNDWEPNGYTMAHVDGEWIINFYLKPGKTLYKFRVDGRWIIDPGNRLWEQNQYGTGNSVLWME